MQNNVNHESEKRKVSKYVKNALIIVGGLAIATTGAILIYKNWDHVTDAARNLLHKSTELSPEIADIQEQLRTDDPKIVHAIINNGEKFPVTEHLRNLPPTWTPSVKQRELAESLGITLGEHQTFVSSYFKNCA